MPATRVRRVCRRCRVYVRGVLHRLYTAAALLWCTSTRLVYGYMSLACVAVGSEAVRPVSAPAVSGCVCPHTLCARGACGAACCVMCSVHCVRTDGARYIFNQSVVKTNTPVGGSAPWVSPSASILPRHRTDGSPPRALRSRHGHAKATVMQCESPHAGALHRSAASVPGQPSQRPVHSRLLHSGTGRARVERSVGSVGRVGR